MFRPAHQAAQCVCHTLTRAQKIIGIWKIQSYWISSTFWHFHLKGHSWLSVRICDAAGEGNYSDSKTMQGRNTAPNHTSRSVLLSFLVPVPLTLLLWWLIGVGPLRGRTQVPSFVKLNSAMGVWLRAPSPLPFQRGGHDAHLKLRLCFRCDPGTGSFQTLLAVYFSAVKAREEIEIIKICICISCGKWQRGLGQRSLFFHPEWKLPSPPFVPIVIKPMEDS